MQFFNVTKGREVSSLRVAQTVAQSVFGLFGRNVVFDQCWRGFHFSDATGLKSGALCDFVCANFVTVRNSTLPAPAVASLARPDSIRETTERGVGDSCLHPLAG